MKNQFTPFSIRTTFSNYCKNAFRLIIIVFFLLSFQNSYAQSPASKKEKKKNHIVWVKPIDNSPRIQGLLSEVGDTIVIAPIQPTSMVTRIDLDNVNYLKFKRKNKGTKIVAGTLIGTGVGALIGLAAFKKCDNRNPSSFGMFVECGANNLNRFMGVTSITTLGALTGCVIGAIAGGKTVRIPIKGSYLSRQEQLKELEKYKYKF